VIVRERGLEKFSPLEKVLVYDDFDLGLNGWLDLTPNFANEDYRSQPSQVDLGSWGPSMLSAAPMRFAASHGSMEGTYSLKLATRPAARAYEMAPADGGLSTVIKRLSRVDQDHRYLQLEAWYSYTPQQDRWGKGEEDIRAFGMWFDVQDDSYRWQPGVRYVNSANGTKVKRWQYFHVSDGVTREQWSGSADGWEVPGIDAIWCGRRYPDGSADGFQWIPDGHQQLVYNESPDKLNWLYMRLTVDLELREYVEFQSMGRTFDLRRTPTTLAPTYDGIWGLINPVFFIETDTDRCVYMYLDSVVYSTGTSTRV
jgi:hypothetical protein